MTSLGIDFLWELYGSATLILPGWGVVANIALTKTKGHGSGFMLVNIGWGLAVYAGVIVSYNSGAHLNPAVTLGLVASGATSFGAGVPVTLVSTLAYLLAQLVCSFIGAVFAWPAHRQHFEARPGPAPKPDLVSPSTCPRGGDGAA